MLFACLYGLGPVDFFAELLDRNKELFNGPFNGRNSLVNGRYSCEILSREGSLYIPLYIPSRSGGNMVEIWWVIISESAMT